MTTIDRLYKSDSASLNGTGIPVVSLFSGCGDLGFVQAGFKPVLAADMEPAACITYQPNHPGVRVLRKDLSYLSQGYFCDRLDELPTSVRAVGVIGGPPARRFPLARIQKWE